MNTLEYLEIYDQVLKHIQPMYKDHTLPPNVVDVNAKMRAQEEALRLHRCNSLINYYNRMKAGTV